MIESLERPEGITNEHLEYLDDLRESGVTNMWGAAPYVENEFDISLKEAQDICEYWRNSFGNPLR